jgi:hypothetical protein
MQAKQKVTLYLSPELHRRLKIRAAVDSEPMSELAERALVFYLKNSELIDEIESSYGRTHRVYSCPSCDSSVVLRDGELVALGNQPAIIEHLKIEELDEEEEASESEKLVPCLK